MIKLKRGQDQKEKKPRKNILEYDMQELSWHTNSHVDRTSSQER